MTIELNPLISTNEWQDYVESHAQGTIFHLPQWKQVLEESFHYKPFYLFARDEKGKLCGVLPLFQVKSPLTGNRLVSLPFSYICGPIADSDALLIELIHHAESLCRDLKCHYLELRMAESKDLGLSVSDYFSTHILELSQPASVWKKLDPKSVRWAINKAKKDGVTVRVGTTTEDLKLFHQLNQRTKKNLGVPAHPFSFLEGICQKLGKFTTLYLAEVGGKTIAGIITLGFKDMVVYAYGASDDKYLNYHPNNLLIWQAIEQSCQRGYRYFDFGKTSAEDEGLAHFKKHWGTEQKKLYYYYYPRVLNLIQANRSGTRYRFITGLWKRLPLFLTRALDGVAFRHLD